MKFVTRLLIVVVCLVAPATALAQKAEMPAPTDFDVGDTWEWRRVDNYSKFEEGRSARTVVKNRGVLMFSWERGNFQISVPFLGRKSEKPWRVWPLEVGKKWVYEGGWTRSDGVTGTTKQDAAVVAYEEVTVPAGKFMAFKIEHRGSYQNSRSGYGGQNETYWYAPDAKADVKHIFNDGYDNYTWELITYKRGAP